MSLEEVKARGWEELDIILISGDAYVDHSSFGTAIIGRVLEDAGFRVGVIAQPRWDSPEDFKKTWKTQTIFFRKCRKYRLYGQQPDPRPETAK